MFYLYIKKKIMYGAYHLYSSKNADQSEFLNVYLNLIWSKKITWVFNSVKANFTHNKEYNQLILILFNSSISPSVILLWDLYFLTAYSANLPLIPFLYRSI